MRLDVSAHRPPAARLPGLPTTGCEDGRIEGDGADDAQARQRRPENADLCSLALKLAGKAGRITELQDYTRALISYAEDASTGTIPSRGWQLDKLGHLVARRPELRPRGTASTGHSV